MRSAPAPAALVLGLGTAAPERCMPQERIYEDVLAPLLSGNRYAPAIFRHAGVRQRHLAVDATYYDQERTTEARNGLYLSKAPQLGEEAIRRCLDAAGYGPGHIDDFIVVSCTGIDTPGLDLQLAARLGLRSDVHRATILGMGCYAALPGLLRAREAARAGRHALLLAVELCSLHFQPQDSSTENVVCSALFADGAAAVLVGPTAGHSGNGSGAQGRASGPRLLDFETRCDYQTFKEMGFHLTEHGFQMRLGASVPQVLAANVEGLTSRLLGRHGLTQEDVSIWAIHPGSGKILDKLQKKLALEPDALDASRAVLAQYGNMSSPTILFVLQEVQQRAQARPGEYGVLMAFGPGLTLEAALLKW